MPPNDRNRNFDEIKRYLAEADQAFARAGAAADEGERLMLIEEAETWLVLAERRLAGLVDRQASPDHPQQSLIESRSFGGERRADRGLVWRRRPHA